MLKDVLGRTIVHATVPVTYEVLYADTQLPVRSTRQSAARDAYAYLKNREHPHHIQLRTPNNTEYPANDELYNGRELILLPGWRAAIPLGFKARIAQGYAMLVLSRSGLALKKDLVVVNAPGLIDSDYPGEWMVPLVNRSEQPLTIQHGERVAQLLLLQTYEDAWVPGLVGQTTDRTGGLGHTGV